MIIDFDGTLMDSMHIWETAGELCLRSMGKEPRENLQKVLKPMSLLQSAGYIKEQYGISRSVSEIVDQINRTVEGFYFHTAEPKPGAVRWLEELHRRGIRMCIATATDRRQAEAALTRCGMRQFFSEIFTCTEVGSGKDRPIIFRRAMEHLETTRDNTAVAEDALHALRTAKADGFRTVAVYDPYEPARDTLRSLADVYLKDFYDLNLFWKFVSAD